jgi:hypothetical protein
VASKRNGELLALAVSRFDVFVTADRNLSSIAVHTSSR